MYAEQPLCVTQYHRRAFNIKYKSFLNSGVGNTNNNTINLAFVYY